MNLNEEKKKRDEENLISKSFNFADYFEALSFVMIADFFLAALFL